MKMLVKMMSWRTRERRGGREWGARLGREKECGKGVGRRGRKGKEAGGRTEGK